jgi:hypothetical protein
MCSPHWLLVSGAMCRPLRLRCRADVVSGLGTFEALGTNNQISVTSCRPHIMCSDPVLLMSSRVHALLRTNKVGCHANRLDVLHPGRDEVQVVVICPSHHDGVVVIHQALDRLPVDVINQGYAFRSGACSAQVALTAAVALTL